MRATRGFRITDSKGFHITFENGYTVSVQFGPGNYADNYGASFRDAPPPRGWQSSTAETGVWGPDGTMLELRELPDGTWERWVASDPDDYADTVQGRQSPSAVLALFSWAASQQQGDVP